jgi:hypothetical protein
MKYSKILLFMTALLCLAFQACAQSDYLGGGSSSSNPDMGLNGMLNWLDQPVPSFPWYSSGGAFYNQAVPGTTFSPYREYYTTTGTPVVGGIVTNPAKFDIAQKTPSSVYYGAGIGLPYSQYASTVSSKTNDLWIQGATNWTQYVVTPVGTWLQLVANAPVGGPAGFYEMIQTDTTSPKYKTYQFNPGYNTMNFNADQAGRHMLYFVVNNQPSNVVVVDVFAQSPAGSAGVSTYPAASQTPVTVLGNAANPGSFATSTSSSQTSNGLTTTTTSNGQTTTTSNGQTIVTPVGQATTTSDGTYQTTTSSDGTTQTTTSSR